MRVSICIMKNKEIQKYRIKIQMQKIRNHLTPLFASLMTCVVEAEALHRFRIEVNVKQIGDKTMDRTFCFFYLCVCTLASYIQISKQENVQKCNFCTEDREI